MTWTQNDEVSVFAPEALLSDIANGTVTDPNDDLSGTLLGALYPVRLSVSDILLHLREPRITVISRPVPEFLEANGSRGIVALHSWPSASMQSRMVSTACDPRSLPLREEPPSLTDVPALLLDRLYGHRHVELSANRLFDWLKAISDLDPGHNPVGDQEDQGPAGQRRATVRRTRWTWQ